MEMVHPSECGFDARRIDHLVTSIKSDIEREQYDGAVVIVARGGKGGLHERNCILPVLGHQADYSNSDLFVC